MKENNFFPIERNRYFYGKLLTVRDFEAEQDYASIKRRLLNRTIHGAGVICGLAVTASDDATLIIESGMALDYLGREVVIKEPLVRKLEMIQGQEQLQGRDTAYLCLAYDETQIEPVNAVGAEGSNQQFNLTREGYKLFFSAQAPDYRSILEAHGKENVRVIYSSELLTLVLFVPSVVCAGEEFSANILVIKNDETLPVSFSIDGESSILETENGRAILSYTQSPENSDNVMETTFTLRAQNLANLSAPLFPNGAELNIAIGDHQYKNFISLDAELLVCANAQQYKNHLRKQDRLEKHLGGGEMPIYLAKLELVNASEKVFLGTVTNLPFSQEPEGQSAAKAGGLDKLSVTTSVKSLEFWQKPDVKANVNQSSGGIHLEFGLPTPEIYDYVTSHGVVDIAMPGGIKVNTRYFSDEIPHGLGPGNVDVRLCIESEDHGESVHIFGNSEVLRGKGEKLSPIWAETAAVVYPQKGSMRIGVWLRDDVKGNLIRVHYYAQKPERDTKSLLNARKIAIKIMPEVSRLERREQTRLKAMVTGSEDKAVLWSVKDQDGGAIDANGIYQAPEIQGTYEIVATARADETVYASAFVIVE